MRQTWATGNSAATRARAFGFTLIELLVVVAIMTMVVGIAPLMLERLSPKLRVIASSDRLIADLQEMRTRALASSEPAVLGRTKNGYRIVMHDHTKEVVLPHSMHLRMTSAISHRDVERIVIYADGSASAVDCEISDSGRHAGVYVDMLTGQTHRTRA